MSPPVDVVEEDLGVSVVVKVCGDHRPDEAGIRIVGGSHVGEIPIISILGLKLAIVLY